MKQAKGDFVPFFRREVDKMVHLSGSYVDDVLQAGTKDAKIAMQDAMKRNIEITASEDAKLAFTGMICDSSRPNLRRISQSHYIQATSEATRTM